MKVTKMIEDLAVRQYKFINWCRDIPERFISLRVSDVTERMQCGDYINMYILNTIDCTFPLLDQCEYDFYRYRDKRCYIREIVIPSQDLIVVHLEVEI